MRSVVKSAKRLVVKVGSSLVTNEGRGLDRAALARWAEQIAALRLQGREVVLVSSGAIAEGMQRLGWKRRPHALHELQAAAAVGQMGLVQAYESCFREHGLHTAQILLTHEDLADRQRYLNARSTLRTLLALGVIPIINENDTVATDEIKFGDNDTLGALVTNLIEADALVILTDQRGPVRRRPAQGSEREARRARPTRWRSRARSDGRRHRQRARPGRHADQGARREARRAQRRPHRHRLRPRSGRAGAPCGRRAHRHAAYRADRCRSPRASSGSPTISACAAGWSSTPAP